MPAGGISITQLLSVEARPIFGLEVTSLRGGATLKLPNDFYKKISFRCLQTFLNICF